MSKKFLSLQIPAGVKDFLEKEAAGLEVSMAVIVRDMLKEHIGVEQWNALKGQEKENLNL